MTQVKPQSRYHRSAGFTLIELLLVMVILAILAAVIVPKFVSRGKQANETAAKSDIATLKLQLDAFEIDNQRYPTSDEGLKALVEKPAGDLPGWKKPYIDKLPNDPWGHPYIYRCPGNNGKDYDLSSAGADGQEGTADDIN